MPMVEQQVHAGNQAVIIQVGRDAGDIVVGGGLPVLRLDPRDLSREDPGGEAARLIPYYRFLDCVGREDWLQRLVEWLKSAAPLSVHTIIGPGGRGKTRLAVELCRMAGEGWQAGFVPDDALQRLYDHHDPATWRWPGPTLVVVDYAARQAGLLRRWLLALKASRGAPPLRILLLERHGKAGGSWWDTLFHSGSWGDEALAGLLYRSEPEELPPLALPHRQALFMQAVRKYGGSGTTLGADPLFQRRLQETDWAGDPLFLAMAVQVAVLEGAESALSLRRTGLAIRLAKREKDRALGLCADGNRDLKQLLPHLMAVVTLCQGLDRSSLMTVCEQEKAALGYNDAGSPGTLADLLSEILPADVAGKVSPIQPDMIGEAFILNELRQDDRAVPRAFRLAGPPVAAAVIRCAQDFARPEDTRPLAWLDALITLPDASTEDLAVIANALPPSSVALMELAVRLYAELVSRLRGDVFTRGVSDNVPALGNALNNLAKWLSALGRREEALETTREAVKIYRVLAEAIPDVFMPHLAGSLNNLANGLSELGRREESLLRAQEAVEIYRVLAATRPDAFMPHLAGFINNLANRLSELGRREEARLRAQEAVEIYRVLAAARPDAFMPNLAASINNLANILSELGQREEALLHAQEAVEIRRALAAARPDAFMPDLAMSINNLANRLSDLGRQEEALLHAQEAVEIRRALAAAHPDAFQPDLAVSLHNLSLRLSELGQHEEALLRAREAVALLGPYFHQNPMGFQRWMKSMIGQYVLMCGQNHCEPDLELLLPLLVDLQNIAARE